MSSGQTKEIVRVLRREAARWLKAGDLPEVEPVLDRLESEAPMDLETRGLRLEYLIRAARTDEAQTLASQLLELFPGSARIHLLAGELAYRTRDYPTALARFEESDRLHQHLRTRQLRGRTLAQLGRLDEAEAALLALLDDRPAARRDLAWVYERRGDMARALEVCERYLRDVPGDPLAGSQRIRLRARLVDADELVAEVEDLVEFGENVSPELIPEYIETLLKTGESARAREFVRENRGVLDDRVKTRTGWVAYKLQAYDMAIELFADVFVQHRRDPKFLTALETAAHRAAQVERVADLFRHHATEEPRLYGRLRRLEAPRDA